MNSLFSTTRNPSMSQGTKMKWRCSNLAKFLVD
jgi:hypothetical protein